MHIEDLHLNRRLFLGGTLTAGALGTTLAAESAAAATGGPRHDQRAGGQSTGVSDEVMRAVYEEVKTPFKYGPVVKTPEGAGNVDSPSVFRYQDHWYMVHLVFRNDGYETLLESSPDLVNWTLEGTILPFRPGAWDAQQAAGYIALQDTRWGGSAELGTYARRYWMSYLGGSDAGYEGGELSIGVASTADPSRPRPWVRLESPVLSPNDPDTRYWERSKLFKSTIIEAPRSMLGSRFVMYYNATGAGGYGNETIGMALSDDMVHWRRYREAPVVLPYEWHGVALIGDPQVVRVGDVWVMFFWNTIDTDPNGRFDSFACSYDLVSWRKWRGQALSSSTRSWDYSQATKPWLIKHEGVVYHFYNAQGEVHSRLGWPPRSTSAGRARSATWRCPPRIRSRSTPQLPSLTESPRTRRDGPPSTRPTLLIGCSSTSPSVGVSAALPCTSTTTTVACNRLGRCMSSTCSRMNGIRRPTSGGRPPAPSGGLIASLSTRSPLSPYGSTSSTEKADTRTPGLARTLGQPRSPSTTPDVQHALPAVRTETELGCRPGPWLRQQAPAHRAAAPADRLLPRGLRTPRGSAAPTCVVSAA